MHRLRRFGCGVLSPLPGFSTLVFVLLMVVYPFTLAVRNYHVGDMDPSLALRAASLQLDLTWMHVATDIVAALYGAWVACKACSPRCPVAAPWRVGSSWRAYGVALCKGGMVCATAYVGAMLPTCIWTISRTQSGLPVSALVFGMTMPVVLFSFGFSLGVFVGSRWALVPAAGLALAYCIAGLLIPSRVPSGEVLPRAWGSSWMVVLPMVDSGMRSEPGVRFNPWMTTARAVFCLMVIACAWWACAMRASRFGEHNHTISWVYGCLVVPVVVYGVVMSLCGPHAWVRSTPFTPVCQRSTTGSVQVCAHPDDTAILHRYSKIVLSFDSWFPTDWSLREKYPVTVLLGNSFTSSDQAKTYNLTDRGMSLITRNGATPVQLQTDTANSTLDLSDVTDVASHLVDRWMPAPCAKRAMQDVFNINRLRDGADVTAYVREQMPMRMAELADWHVGVMPGSAHDQTAQNILELEDEQFRTMVRTHMSELEQCQVNPKQVAVTLSEETR